MAYSEISARLVNRVSKQRMCEWCAGRIEKGESASHESDNRYLEDGWMPGDFDRGQAAL
jgi:hypothetical protein